MVASTDTAAPWRPVVGTATSLTGAGLGEGQAGSDQVLSLDRADQMGLRQDLRRVEGHLGQRGELRLQSG